MIYIGIPVYNERHTIGPLLWRIREMFAELGRDYRVLVLDDASDDGTAEALEPYPKALSLTILRNTERLGYAASLERLVREAVARSDYPKRDALVTLQGDFTDPPEAIRELIRRFEGGVDLVLTAASPEEEGTKKKEEEELAAAEEEAREPCVVPRSVRMARLGARFLARKVPRPPGVEEPYGSQRLYRLFTLARAVDDLPSKEARLLTQQGWAANAELLLTVWPHVRRKAVVRAEADYGRRYRATRLRAFAQVRSLRRAARGGRLAELAARSAMTRPG